MKVVILYRSNSDHARAVEEYIHDFRRQYPEKSLTVLDLDTKDGAATAARYDAVRYPAVIATADDGIMLNMWQGENLPLKNEVLAYT